MLRNLGLLTLKLIMMKNVVKKNQKIPFLFMLVLGAICSAYSKWGKSRDRNDLYGVGMFLFFYHPREEISSRKDT